MFKLCSKHEWGDYTDITPMPVLPYTTPTPETTWEQIEQIAGHGRRPTTNICCHYLYGHHLGGMPGVCALDNCNRVHTNDIDKLRYIYGQKFKLIPCINGYHCKHAVCAFMHPEDPYLFHTGGMRLNDTRSVKDVIAERRIKRHEAWLKERE